LAPNHILFFGAFNLSDGCDGKNSELISRENERDDLPPLWASEARQVQLISGEVLFTARTQFSRLLKQIARQIVATWTDEAFRQITKECLLLPAGQRFRSGSISASVLMNRT
jgi:hypothetical protein